MANMATACNKPPIPKNKPRLSAKRPETTKNVKRTSSRDSDEPMYYEIDGDDSSESSISGRPVEVQNVTTSSHKNEAKADQTVLHSDKTNNKLSETQVKQDVEVLYSKVNKPPKITVHSESPKADLSSNIGGQVGSPVHQKSYTKLKLSNIGSIQSGGSDRSKHVISPSPAISKQISFFESLDQDNKSDPGSPEIQSKVKNIEILQNSTETQETLSRNSVDLEATLVVENSAYDRRGNSRDVTIQQTTAATGPQIPQMTIPQKAHGSTVPQKTHGIVPQNTTARSEKPTPQDSSDNDSDSPLYEECKADVNSSPLSNDDSEIPPYAVSKKKKVPTATLR